MHSSSRRAIVLLLAIAGALLAAPSAQAAPFAGARCTLATKPGLMWGGNLGPTNRKQYAIPSTGRVRAKMLFVDYPGAEATADESTHDLYDSLVPTAARRLRTASGRRLTLSVDALHAWKRMPRSADAYDTSTGDGMTRLMQDAIAAVDDEVDFRPYKLVYVVVASAGARPLSPAFITSTASQGVLADGVRIRGGAAFGSDARQEGDYPAMILAHETGHALGLPDLYRVATPAGADYHPWIGGWDQMGNLYTGTGYTQWVRRKLGWLPASGVRCANRTAGLEVTLRGANSRTGSQLVVVPTSRYTAVAVEARLRSGLDATLCDSGVLAYTVDTRIATGKGPMRVLRTGAADANGCGRIDSSTLDRGEGETCSLVAKGVRIEVVGETSTTYRVRVRPAAAKPDPRVADCR